MTDTEAVRRLFDDLAAEYDQHIPFFRTFGRDLVAWCGVRPGQRVLDVAAGRGAVAGPAARAVGPDGEVLAIDNAPSMLRALAADHPGLPQLTTQVMDAHRLGIPDACFDIVTCGFAFHFLDDPGRAIAEAHRVLRPGGLLAFSGPPTGPMPEEEPEKDQPGKAKEDHRWDFFSELMQDMSERPSGTRRPDPFTPPPRPLTEICADAGFTGLEQRAARAVFTLRNPRHYWDWCMSHGFRGYVDSLGPELTEEFRARMLAGLERMHVDGGITVDSTIAFTSMRKAGRSFTRADS